MWTVCAGWETSCCPSLWTTEWWPGAQTPPPSSTRRMGMWSCCRQAAAAWHSKDGTCVCLHGWAQMQRMQGMQPCSCASQHLPHPPTSTLPCLPCPAGSAAGGLRQRVVAALCPGPLVHHAGGGHKHRQSAAVRPACAAGGPQLPPLLVQPPGAAAGAAACRSWCEACQCCAWCPPRRPAALLFIAQLDPLTLALHTPPSCYCSRSPRRA